MKRPLNVHPIGGEEPTDWVDSWNDAHPDTPLQIVDAPDQCQAYLACDLAADVIDAEIQDRHLPDRPVIWPPYVYNSCGDFMQENSTCYDQLLHTIYGIVTRDSLLATLREAKAALDYSIKGVRQVKRATVVSDRPCLARRLNLINQLRNMNCLGCGQIFPLYFIVDRQ